MAADKIVFNEYGYKIVRTPAHTYVVEFGQDIVMSTRSFESALSCIVAHQAGRMNVMRTYMINQEKLRELDRYD